jgi:hypothetical protein
MDRRASINRSDPFGKGRGGCSSSLVSEGAVAVSMEHTSLSRGEGLARRRSTVEVGGREGEGEGCGWRRKERTSEINRDAVDVKLKLRSPTKIEFDMNAYESDSKIKISIALKAF